jgi:MerR family copper efflux transcriptional regulator
MRPMLKIGELARRAGVTAKAIRFYEARGVLPPASRGANRYRLYEEEAAAVLAFVRQAAGLGLSLAEIREVIAIRQGGQPPCAHVHRLLRDKLAELERKLTDLLEVRARLQRSLAAWRRMPGGRAAVCPHIEHERREHPAPAARARPSGGVRGGRTRAGRPRAGGARAGGTTPRRDARARVTERATSRG